jgi:hypothetical protein
VRDFHPVETAELRFGTKRDGDKCAGLEFGVPGRFDFIPRFP